MICAVPAIFWIGYFYYRDRFKAKPLILTVFIFLLGFASYENVHYLSGLAGLALAHPHF